MSCVLPLVNRLGHHSVININTIDVLGALETIDRL